MIMTLKIIIKMNVLTPITPQTSTHFPIVRSRIPTRIATETHYMYDSETGRHIPVAVAKDTTDRFEGFNLEKAIRAATEYNIQTNRVSAQHREFYLGADDVAGPMSPKSQLDKLKAPHTPIEIPSAFGIPNPLATNTPASLEFSTALLAGNFNHVGQMMKTEWNNWLARFKSGDIESPTLMGRVRDLGVDEVKALGLSFVTTQAATMMIESAFVLAWTGPVSEKAVFIASGFAKFRAISSTKSVPLLVLGTLIMAAPNMLADIVFHDSIYTQLAECGFNEGFSGVAVVPFSFIAALACAVMLQYGTYKTGYKLIERRIQRDSNASRI